MKLSDAIILGSTNVKLMPQNWLCKDGGCLIGMGFSAIGHKEISIMESLDWNLSPFPWLEQKFDVPEMVVKSKNESALFRDIRKRKTAQASSIISFMAYMVKEGEITLEQAVDWIRSVEPRESKTEAELQSEWKQELVEVST